MKDNSPPELKKPNIMLQNFLFVYCWNCEPRF